jgi:hypothetical protein
MMASMSPRSASEASVLVSRYSRARRDSLRLQDLATTRQGFINRPIAGVRSMQRLEVRNELRARHCAGRFDQEIP